MKSNKKIVIGKKFSTTVLSFLLLVTTAWAQQPAEELATYKKKYPGESSISLVKHHYVTIDLDKEGKLDVSTIIKEKNLIIDNKGANISERSLEYSSFTGVEDIEAATFTPNGKKYKQLKVSDYKTKDVLDGAIFYNDIKSISFHYSGIQNGAKTFLKYKKTYKEPRFLSGFYLAGNSSIDHLKYTVKVHPDVNIAYSLKNTEGMQLNFKETTEKGYKVYTWEANAVKKLKFESGSPGFLYYIPHIIVRVTDYQSKGKKERLLANVDDLHAWYYSLVKDINQDEKTELKRLADSLVAGVDSDFEKVKIVYYWVQDNIKYVAFEDGLGGFIPRNATAICSKRFGDCKDMSSIITTMLDLVGVESHLTWIGTNDIPYSYEEVPTPAVDNHMIAAFKNEKGEYIFLDGTGNHTPITHPSGFTQGKEAMINLGGGKYEIATVPVVPAEQNFIAEKVNIKIDGDGIMGNSKADITGYYKVRLAYKLDGLDRKGRKEYMNSYLRKGSNKFLIDKIEEAYVLSKDTMTQFEYDFNVQDYVNYSGDEIYVNMNLEKPYINEKIESDRELPIERNFQNKLSYEINLEIPDGYSAEYIPEKFTYQHDLFSFSVVYKEEQGKVSQKLEIQNNFMLLEKDNFSAWNDMIKEMKKAYNEVIILKKN